MTEAAAGACEAVHVVVEDGTTDDTSRAASMGGWVATKSRKSRWLAEADVEEEANGKQDLSKMT